MNEEEDKLRKQLHEDLWRVASSVESIAWQKARSRWIKEEDCNSRYFHLTVNWKRRYNMLRGVYVGGCWIDEPSRVKEKTKLFSKGDLRNLIGRDRG